jgi:Ca2+-binding EF-hand superfamily protein
MTIERYDKSEKLSGGRSLKALLFLTTSTCIALASLLAVSGSSAHAASVEVGELKSHFDRLDVNHDAKLSLDEVEGELRGWFRSKDINHDSLVTKDEAGPESFAQFDLNNDGKISIQEVVDVELREFKGADKNKDKFLSLEEYEVMASQ